MTDVSITAASVVSGSDDIEYGVLAAEAVTAGKVVYKNAAGKWALADSDGAAALHAAKGVALNGASLNQPLAVQKSGPITIGGTLVAGDPYYLSNTAGGICPKADVGTGEEVVLLGLAASTTVLDLDIQKSGVTL